MVFLYFSVDKFWNIFNFYWPSSLKMRSTLPQTTHWLWKYIWTLLNIQTHQINPCMWLTWYIHYQTTFQSFTELTFTQGTAVKILNYCVAPLCVQGVMVWKIMNRTLNVEVCLVLWYISTKSSLIPGLIVWRQLHVYIHIFLCIFGSCHLQYHICNVTL